MATIGASSAPGFMESEVFPRCIGVAKGSAGLVRPFCVRRVYGARRRAACRRLVARCSDNSLASPGSNEDQWQWSLQSKVRSCAGTIGDAIRGLLGRFQSKGREDEDQNEFDRQWQRWMEYFELVGRDEKMISALKIRLADAVKLEDYAEAARLKLLIADKIVNDTAGKVMNQMAEAIKEERYRDAILFRDETAAGLVGWWAGFAENTDDPYGKIIHITPRHGRFVATSYNARQLAAGSPGIPLFEIFITEDSNDSFKQQAVYLQPNVQCEHDYLPGSPKASKVVEADREKIDDPDLEDDGLKYVLRFLRRRMPGLNFKVSRTATQGQSNKDLLSGVLEQFIQDVIEQREEESYFSEGKVRRDFQYDKLIPEGNMDFIQHIEVAAAKVAIGSLIQRIAEDAPLSYPLRIPAKLERKVHDTFCFQIRDAKYLHTGSTRKLTSSWRIAATASDDYENSKSSKGRLNTGGVSMKVALHCSPHEKRRRTLTRIFMALEDLGEIITLAVSEAQKRRNLLGSTVFHHINLERANDDPFSGLYANAFGPYPSEVVQLHRKFGQWKESEDSIFVKDSKLEFYEYVEAVKLTGDGNVLAGQVIFRARIGKENQLPCNDIFPDELGVIARYTGQERVPVSGFRKSKWIDAELLLLDNKGIGHAGPHLGFLSSHHLIPVLFNRLKLPQ